MGDEFDEKYGDEEEEYIESTEIKNSKDYASALSDGIFLAGNGFSASYSSSQFDQKNFPPPALLWRKKTLIQIVEFLMEDHNIFSENMWKQFSDMVRSLFREAFIFPILSLHKNLYDSNKIEIYKNKLEQYDLIYTLNYDLILPWTKLSNIKYLHGNINLMFLVNSLGQEQTLGDYGIDIYADFTDEILEKILELRKKEDISLTEVYGGSHYEKLSHIYSCRYLQDQFNSLGSISGNLIIFGCSIGVNDKHLWEKIDSNNNIDRLWIGVKDESKINDLKAKVEEYFSRLNRANKVEYFHSENFFKKDM